MADKQLANDPMANYRKYKEEHQGATARQMAKDITDGKVCNFNLNETNEEVIGAALANMEKTKEAFRDTKWHLEYTILAGQLARAQILKKKAQD